MMCSRLLLCVALLAGALAVLASSASASRSADTVNIGVSEMLTGVGATYGQAVLKGVQLAADQINAKGGILGHQVKLTIKDNASDNAQAVNIVRGFAQDNSIPAAIPPTYQPNFEASCAVANQLGLPVISAQSAPPPSNPKGYCFVATSPIATQTGITIKRVALRLHLKRFGMIHDQQNLYQSNFDKVAEDYIKKFGYQLVSSSGVNSETTDYGPQITKLIQSNAQVVIPNLTTEDAARFIQQARARGLKAVFLSPDTNLTNQRIYKLSGGAADGLITANNQSPAIPSYAAFLKAFTKKYGPVDDPSYSGYGYDAMKILAAAMTKAGTLTDREKIQKALAGTKEICASICFKNDGKGSFLTPNLYFVKLTKNGWVPAKELS